MGRKNVNMLSGPIVSGILAIAIPVMIMNVVSSLFNIVDMSILKGYAQSKYTVGAVGVCGTLITAISGLAIGSASGSNVVIAKFVGAKDEFRVSRAIHTSIALSLVAGLLLAVVGVGGAELFLKWVNCPAEQLPEATLYFRMYFAGIPLLMYYNFGAAVLRSFGDSRRPMIFLTISGAVKVVLTYVFVAYFQLGVVGVSLATILSWTLLAVVMTITLLRNEGMGKVEISKIRLHKEELLQILRIGIPAGLQQVLYSIANVLISATVNTFGAAATTGISIANNFDNILYQISTASALAVMPYVSQNVGAGNIKRAVQSIWRGMMVTICLGASLGALSAIFSGPLSYTMTNDPAVVAYSQQKMMLVSSTYFICGINEILGAALRGMGKPSAPTVSTLVFMCLIRFVWVQWIYPFLPEPKLTFLYLIWPIGWVLSIATLLCVLLPTVKKLRRQQLLAEQIA